MTGKRKERTQNSRKSTIKETDFQIAKSVPEYSGHAGSESRFADQYFSSLLGLVLLLTFILTGHGLGATGFTTRLSAWLGDSVLPAWTLKNEYLGPFLEDGPVLSSWISWQVLGVFAGGLASAWLAGRMRWRIEGAASAGRGTRLLKAVAGGILAGFGARIAAGCTSGVGLSGSAVLGVAGFVFLGAFFAAGLLASRLTGGGVR